MAKVVGALLVSIASAADPFPASAGDGSWQWVPVEGTRCMGGEETGVYVRYSKNGNKNLGVYLYGGGACFNTITCNLAATTNPHPADMGSDGIFASRSDNPLEDYNWVTVPYCTGDVHTGNAESPKSFATHHYDFYGSVNLKLILDRAQLSFQDVGTLFVTGESAGGFGSLASYPTVRDYFPAARGVLMDDSGQILGDDYITPCLQVQMRQLWNINDALPADCPCNNDEGNLVTAWEYGRSKYPNDSFSLISSVNDAVMSLFFGFGMDNCKALLPTGFNKMHEGLEDLAATGVNIYMIPGSGHTHTSHSEFYSRTVDGKGLYEWVGQLLDPNQADPATVRPTSEDLVREAMSGRVANTTRPYAGVVV